MTLVHAIGVVVVVLVCGCAEAVLHTADVGARRRHHKQQVSEEQRTHAAFQRRLRTRADELRTEASEAAREGNCGRVLEISEQVKALPLEDGDYHDTVLLADPKVAECIALAVTPAD